MCVCRMFQRVFEGVFKGRFKSVLWVNQGCFKGCKWVSMCIPRCYRAILTTCPVYFTVVSLVFCRCIKGVSRVSQGCCIFVSKVIQGCLNCFLKKLIQM